MPAAGNGGPGGETARWSVDFWIDDADAPADKATELGGSVVVPPYEVLSFRQAVLADPQGAAFSVSQLIVPG
jgi:predicted enzyme related to lactoylglutathione lyase